MDTDDRIAQASDLSESLLEENVVPKPVGTTPSINDIDKPKAVSVESQLNAAFVFSMGVIVFLACCFGAYGKVRVEHSLSLPRTTSYYLPPVITSHHLSSTVLSRSPSISCVVRLRLVAMGGSCSNRMTGRSEA